MEESWPEPEPESPPPKARRISALACRRQLRWARSIIRVRRRASRASRTSRAGRTSCACAARGRRPRWCPLQLVDSAHKRRRSAGPPCKRSSAVRSKTAISRSSVRVSLLGDDRLPAAWSADLVTFLGTGSAAAMPLACAARRTASRLLFDSTQASVSAWPEALALSRTRDWGEHEQTVMSRAEHIGGLMQALVPLGKHPGVGGQWHAVAQDASSHGATSLEAARSRRTHLREPITRRSGSLPPFIPMEVDMG